MNTLAEAWLGQNGLFDWTMQQTNAALRDHAAASSAEALLRGAGLPTHPDRAKNWDTFLALFHAVTDVDPSEAILDAGAERYSAFLPALRSLGYGELTGINLTFGAAAKINGITFQHGDITQTGLAPQSYAFISCLSVIEHGVDVEAFLRESARLLCSEGRLFVSFDYWEDSVDTHGQQAYGGPIRIFTRQDIGDMLACAEKYGLFVEGDANFKCQDRVVHWQRFDLRYTFANMLFRRGADQFRSAC